MRVPDIKNGFISNALNAEWFSTINQERHLIDRENFKLQRNAALAEWRQLYSTNNALFRGKYLCLFHGAGLRHYEGREET